MDHYTRFLLETHGIKYEGMEHILTYLNAIPFRWLLDLDENRAIDGLELRNDILESDSEITESLLAFRESPATILEVLIGLAHRMDDALTTWGDSSKVDIWFWEMVRNLGLTKFTDDYMVVSPEIIGEVNDILDGWMDRTYDFDGRGGLFPLMNPETDQRFVEIWYQMSYYIHEFCGLD